MNPYTSIQGDQAMAQPPDMAPPVEMEVIREGGLKHENSIRSVGILYYMGGTVMAIGIGFVLYNYLTAPGALGRTMSSGPMGITMMAIFAGLCPLYFALGYGLRKVRPWVRIPVGILSAIFLIRFPIGTLIGGYILWLVAGKQGAYIFGEEYQEAMRMTPHMKYKPKASMVSIIILAILVLAILGLIIAILTKSI